MISATIALGAFTGSALAAPANDDFASAEALSGNRGTAFVDLTDATVESGEPADGGTDERTVWFTYTPSASGFASFSICDTYALYEIAGAQLTAFTGSSLNALSVVDNSGGGCPAGQVNAAITNMPVTSGTTYRLQVGNTSAAEVTGVALTYDFNTALPANDNFVDASTISGALPQTIDADTGLATTEAGEPDVDSWGAHNSLWYRWTPDADGPVAIDTCTTVSENPAHLADSRLQVFTNGNDPADLAGLTVRASGDDGCPAANPVLTRTYVYVQSGTEYWIQLVNYGDRFGAAYKMRMRWVTTPELSGTPLIVPQPDALPVGEPLLADIPDWYASPAISTVDTQWQLCDSAGASCADIPGATGSSYTPVTGDGGRRLKLKVTASNGAESSVEYSAASNPVEAPAPPVVDPPAPSPPKPVDPFPQPAVAKSLGNLKLSKKNTITLSKLSLTCGATATGPCSGSITFATKKTRKGKVTIKPMKFVYKLSAKPGARLAPTFKLSPAVAKAVRVAKSLKTTITIQFGAPGFSLKSAGTSATLKA